jgi:hypothetical protein
MKRTRGGQAVLYSICSLQVITSAEEVNRITSLHYYSTKMGSRHLPRGTTPLIPTDAEDAGNQITEYERARNVRAKALRDEVDLALIAGGHADVATLQEKLQGAVIPSILSSHKHCADITKKQATLSGATVRRSARNIDPDLLPAAAVEFQQRQTKRVCPLLFLLA